MQNTFALLLTLVLFSSLDYSLAQETHQMEYGEVRHEHSSPPISGFPEDKAYSEFMHRLNGIFVLLLGILALLEHRLPNVGFLRWGWPLLFLLSGVYLVVQSDQDVWPIGEKGFIEGLQDPEILQHKIAAAILLLLGVSELFLRAGWRQASLGWVFPSLCIAAGVLLFVHGHMGHQSSGIFMQHIVMGGTALCIGFTRFLSGKFEGSKRGWIFLLLLFGLELLFYRE
jgi:putative copper resistance protein D